MDNSPGMYHAPSVIDSDHCPKCQVSWIGPRVTPELCQGEEQNERYFSRILCTNSYGLDAVEWKCPDCGARFNQFSAMPQE